MTDDVPVQITLYPPTTDIETSRWAFLAPTLWHAGLIWFDYEMVVFALDPIELRIWCSFTDRHAFDSWREHRLVKERCATILSSRIDVVETCTPWARHDKLFVCKDSTAFFLYGHGFGNRKSILYCCDCIGYIPNYRLLELDQDQYSQLQSWALVSGHVCDIWMLTANLEGWALNELQSPQSELNSSGRQLANLLAIQLKKPVWYSLFVQWELRDECCPCCNSTCERAIWREEFYACDGCHIVY